MIRDTLLAFDNDVPASVTMYSSDEFDARLALYDQISVQALVDNVQGSGGTFSTWLEHSGDGETWLVKTPDIGVSGSLTVSSTNVFFFFGEAEGLPPQPTLQLVRLGVKVTGTSAHVRLHTVHRDTSD